MARTVLYIGGTGIISSACVARSLDKGFEVSVLNRGNSASKRPLPEGVHSVEADLNDWCSVTTALEGLEFDVVCDFFAFTPGRVQQAVDEFTGRTGQYVFISSASAYQTPARRLPITESTPLVNPHWQYSRNKIACEDLLVRLVRERDFPATIVRPSHTYDRRASPLDGGGSTLRRVLEGREVVVHGDGSSLWTLTHNTDFAKGFVGLLDLPAAIGDAFHITNDEWLTCDAIVTMLADAAGQEPNIVHVPSDAIASAAPEWGAGLLGDKTHSFDNSKVKALVPEFVCTTPFSEGAREIVEWHRADQSRLAVDQAHDATVDQLVERFRI